MWFEFAAGSVRGSAREVNCDAAYASPGLLAVTEADRPEREAGVASAVIAAVAATDTGNDGGAAADRLASDAIQRAGRALVAESFHHDHELAASLTVLALANGQLGLGHIGKTQAHMLRRSDDGPLLFQITQDHVLTCSPARDEHGLQSGVPIQVVSSEYGFEPDLRLRDFHTTDRYMLCSDGLTMWTEPMDLYEILRTRQTPAAAVDDLLTLARGSRTRDDITCVVADITTAHPPIGPVTAGAPAAGAGWRRRRRTGR
jgi:protein phosphatase